MDVELIVAVFAPLLAAAVFRVPRHTLVLAKEAEVLSHLAPQSPAHQRLEAHVEKLVEREIEANNNWLTQTESLQGIFVAAYGLLLLLAGLDLGGWWILLAIVGGLLVASPSVVAGIRIAPHVGAAARWFKERRQAI